MGTEPSTDENRVYLDLLPVRSFLHTSCGHKSPTLKRDTCTQVSTEDVEEASAEIKEVRKDVCYDVARFWKCFVTSFTLKSILGHSI